MRDTSFKWVLSRLNFRNARRWIITEMMWEKMTGMPPPVSDAMGPMDDTPCDEEPDWSPDPDDEEEL